MAREVEAVFPNIVVGVAPAILKEQLEDQLEKVIRSTSPERLMAESDASMVGAGRTTNHPWSADESYNNQGCPAAYNVGDT